MNMRNGQRVSTNDAYLEPARERPNLTILGDTLVDRVEFLGSRVTGVRVRTAAAVGRWYRVELSCCVPGRFTRRRF
jgi:choline dehydrogenase-like flavoprotein